LYTILTVRDGFLIFIIVENSLKNINVLSNYFIAIVLNTNLLMQPTKSMKLQKLCYDYHELSIKYPKSSLKLGLTEHYFELRGRDDSFCDFDDIYLFSIYLQLCWMGTQSCAPPLSVFLRPWPTLKPNI